MRALCPQVGDEAPDFELDGTHGRFRLSEHRGRPVALLFYPMDRGVVCARQFGSYAARREELGALDACIVGISGQDVSSHHDFRARHGIPVPLLADPILWVARAYGVFAPVIGTRRAVFVLDAAGVVRHRHVHPVGLSYWTVDELRRALQPLSAVV